MGDSSFQNWPHLKIRLTCTWQGCKPFNCPASRCKEHRVSKRDINGLLDRGSYLTPEARGFYTDRLFWVADGRLAVARVFPVRRGNCYRGNWYQDGSLVTGETSRGAQLSCPFDKPSLWSCSDFKITTVSSCGGGNSVGVYWSGSMIKRQDQSGDRM